MSVSSQYRNIDAVAAQGSKSSYSSFRGSTAVVAVAAGLMLSVPGPGGEGRCAAAIRPKRNWPMQFEQEKKKYISLQGERSALK